MIRSKFFSQVGARPVASQDFALLLAVFLAAGLFGGARTPTDGCMLSAGGRLQAMQAPTQTPLGPADADADAPCEWLPPLLMLQPQPHWWKAATGIGSDKCGPHVSGCCHLPVQ